MELWDAYDEHLNKINGLCLVRGEPIPKGVDHLVCEVLVRHTDGTYLVMKRDFCKNLGGRWEATAGGSALRGETPAECAIRELLEETGIYSPNPEQVGIQLSAYRNTIYYQFICTTDINKSEIKPQRGETIDYCWLPAAELLSMSEDELASVRMLKYVE